MTFVIATLIKAALIAVVLLTTAAYLVWIERKVLGHIQLRPGPYRVGPHGLLQPLADLIKLVAKEGLMPAESNHFFFLLAPFLAVFVALLSIAVIPFGPEVEIFGYRTQMGLANINVALLFILAGSSLGVYSIVMGGWASNSKYSLLGGLRSSAQMISYELPMAMALAAPLLLVNSLNFREIVAAQDGFYFGFLPRWTLFMAPIPQVFSFILFMIAAFAETNRIPFDLPEAESELVSGFNTEYSSTLFAAFATGEYCNIVTACCVATLLFLGGWQPLWPAALGSNFAPTILFGGLALIAFFHASQPTRFWDKYSYPVVGLLSLVLAAVFQVPMLQPVLIPLFWFLSKVGFLIFVFIWIRGTLPRFRYDQLMSFAWTFMFPVAVANLLLTGLLVALL